MPFRDDTIDSEILAVHAAVIPGGGGRVLLFGGDEHNGDAEESDSADGWKKTRVYDVAGHDLLSGTVPSPDSDVFCAGHAYLPDGRLLIGGGTSKWREDDPDHPGEGVHHVHGLSFGGHRRCWVYNPSDNAWVETAEMLRQPGKTTGGGRWYPTLVTLGSGEVIAFFGHPRFDDDRHRNTIAERYSATTDSWAPLPQMADPNVYPGSGGIRYLMYPRVFVVPDGRLFFASGMPVTAETTYHSTFYDPVSGDWDGTPIGEPPGYGNGWDYPAVLLPLLPEEGYRSRILFAGNLTPQKIDLGAATPAWQATTARTGSVAGMRRRHAMAVLLPTGKVCVINGVNVVGGDGTPEEGTLRAEVYDPGIDWAAGNYGGTEGWTTDEDDAQHTRNYHSTALLLPDGNVWTAGGNTNAGAGDPDALVDPGDGTQKRRGIKVIELWEPDYANVAGRPEITDAPAVLAYGQSFRVTCPQASTIERVALIRFGSVTHGHNYDQRYVGLQFQREGDFLFCVAPPHGNVAPPGFYMLWVVDEEDRPCRQAAIVRLAGLNCDLVLDRSTLSRDEVEALLSAGSPATITNAVYAVFDGFRPSELGSPPTPPGAALRFADDDSAIATGDMRLVHRETLLEDADASADVVQRVTFVYDIAFGNLDVFDAFDEQRLVTATLETGPHRCTGTLTLLNQPNPYMRDIDPAADNPHWLSVDLRVFQIAEGEVRSGVTQGGGGSAPQSFIDQLLTAFNGAADGPGHPFEAISTDQSSSRLELARVVEGRRVYNYAVAKVRYRAQAVNAENVQVFFRMFTTAATNLRYDVTATYARSGAWPDSVPLLGKVAGELASLPFFAAARVDTVGADGQSMTEQDDPLNRRTVLAGGVDEVTEYFGCWLDINQTTPRFPLLPGAGDGPFDGATPLTEPRSIQELVRGLHQCLVAEIRFQPGMQDPIPAQAGPGQSDRLAQRNLAIVESDNPGGPDSRTVAHTFEIAPSPGRPTGFAFGPRFNAARPVAAIDGRRRFSKTGPDELLIRWSVPPGTEVELFFADLDVDDILALAATRQGPPVLRRTDDGALAVTAGPATWIPIPGGRDANIASLLTVRLPAGVRKGERYSATVLQVSGVLRTVLGAFELSIPVGKAAGLRAGEVRALSVLRHVASTIPPINRWNPVFSRYLDIVAGRVAAFGTDPATVAANPDGTGVVYVPGEDDDDRPDDGGRDPGGKPGDRPGIGTPGRPPHGSRLIEGYVRHVVYDACGCFEGFVLETCEGRSVSFRTHQPGIERVVRDACAAGMRVAVAAKGRRLVSLALACRC
jgi:hypothetical protein